MSPLGATCEQLIQQRDEARAIARQLAHAIKKDHEPDPREPGSCMFEYPCDYRDVMDAFDALHWPDPEGE